MDEEFLPKSNVVFDEPGGGPRALPQRGIERFIIDHSFGLIRTTHAASVTAVSISVLFFLLSIFFLFIAVDRHRLFLRPSEGMTPFYGPDGQQT